MNQLSERVRINWIHGALVNRMLDLEPRQTSSHSVFLSHTLQARVRSASRPVTARGIAWTAPAIHLVSPACRCLLAPGRGFCTLLVRAHEAQRRLL